MLKIFSLAIIIFFSALLLAPIAFSMPLSQNSALIAEVTVTNPQPQIQSEKTENVEPSETTENNQNQDSSATTLEPAANPTPKPTVQSAYPQPPHPYNMKKIEEFDQELYGD